ncbi:tellurite resistance TerB family protein [Vibrio aestuarianus]|uniref:Inner membrane protein YebE n=1 Tax=Vibrio aestuarianus TaxID=28171 RepID=A0ABM9FS51_9VIBR|nr:tellurite resistance TerB family protein [Vibrio aestuarianus]MDE1213963.1 tellurite resistance TerB family protein [Vibrio aestuarianus]MDE1217543.1 tellurite resistance TerB family protein [Vibrio aestuarianus]MDE1228803.1 tellurite resistance TerB family protein [Vibrio aestuarianus]MDE1257281.1 tellurite resistance TerB family protein [Vibrio aestuarianus]MDE1260959.1 tellurite resistance TerB family protein [Vibrio aestuarianus]
MDLKSLLNQALNSNIVKQGSTQLSSITQDSSKLKTLGAGAVGGGLIGLLMGSKKTKKIGKKVLGIGGAAALGVLAYKAYNDWQAKQTTTQPQATFDPDDSNHSVLILKAMIAAAKADGHVDEQEMSKIEQAIVEMGADAQLQQLVKNELHKPLDPAAIAQLATTPEQASELYLASLLIADEQNFMEKAYLNELAKQLRLADDLVLALEQQVNA